MGDGAAMSVKHYEKPSVRNDEWINFIWTAFGMRVKKHKLLTGYCDLNFHILVEEQTSNSYLGFTAEEGYAMKIFTNEKSNVERCVHLNSLLRFLRQKGYPVPEPVMSKRGNDVEFMDFTTENNQNGIRDRYLVRVWSYITGGILTDEILDKAIVEEISTMLASLAITINQDYKFTYSFDGDEWVFSRIETFIPYADAVESMDDRRLLISTMEVVAQNLTRWEQHFSKGFIHGDVNDTNVLVRRCDEHAVAGENDAAIAGIQSGALSKSRLRLCGLLDWDTCAHSCYVYDVAIYLAYTLYQRATQGGADWLEFGAHVVRAYCARRPLRRAELAALPALVACRLAQSLAMGRFCYRFIEADEFYLATATVGYRLLRELRARQDADTAELWYGKKLPMEDGC